MQDEVPFLCNDMNENKIRINLIPYARNINLSPEF
jgi:hypothetical protein